MLRLFFACALGSALFLAGCSCASDTDSSFDDDAGGMVDTDGAIPDVDGGPTPDGGSCVDMDMDGVTDCMGDCDDADPNTYPGATEVCGDGVTNDCSMNPPDQGCLGAYVAPPPLGADANPGTMTMPVATIMEGIAHAMALGSGADVFVAAGTYDEDVIMMSDISVLGGYESSGWTRDPSANVSVINATTAAGVSFSGRISDMTLLDGFTVNGFSGSGSAAAVTMANRVSAVVSNNIINAPSSGGASYGIDVNPADVAHNGRPTIEDNEINLGNSAGGWGANNGGWGIRARQTRIEILRNRINLVNDDTIQRGIDLPQSPGTSIIDGNVVRGSNSGASDRAFGITAFGGDAIIRNNDIDPGACQGSCWGINLGGDGNTIRVENNVVFGGSRASETTYAFSIGFERAPTTVPEINVSSNFFHGGSGARSVGIHLGECPGVPIVAGRFFNNIVYSGTGVTSRYAVAEQHPNIDVELFQNNALHLMPLSTGATAGALYRDDGNPGFQMCVPSGSGADVTTAADVNMIMGAAANIEDDCSVTNPMVGGDFHLGAGSNCIDAGATRLAPSVDFEGDARPMGMAPDIGPDEAG